MSKRSSRAGSRSGVKAQAQPTKVNMSIPKVAEHLGVRPEMPTGPAQPFAAAPRPIIDRMTSPSLQDQNVGDRIRSLSRPQMEMAVNHVCQALEHLATQRDDLHVTRTQDESGITVRVEFR